jgi:hypothetical protein
MYFPSLAEGVSRGQARCDPTGRGFRPTQRRFISQIGQRSAIGIRSRLPANFKDANSGFRRETDNRSIASLSALASGHACPLLISSSTLGRHNVCSGPPCVVGLSRLARKVDPHAARSSERINAGLRPSTPVEAPLTVQITVDRPKNREVAHAL